MLFFGGCYQHSNTSSLGIPVYGNMTRVLDFRVPVTGNLPPYIRNTDVSTWPSCAGSVPDPCGDYSNGYPLCNRPEGADIVACSGGATISQGGTWNCYTQSTATMSLDACERYGFKKLAARKIWHGRQSYRSRDVEQVDYTNVAMCYDCNVHSLDATPDPTHYLTITASGYARFQSPDFGVDLIGSCGQTVTVNRYTGKRSVSCVSSSNDLDNLSVLEAAQAAMWAADGNVSDLGALVCSVGGYMDMMNATYGTPVFDQINNSTMNVKWYGTRSLCLDPPNCSSSLVSVELVGELTVNYGSSLSVIGYGFLDNYGSSWGVKRSFSYTWSDTTYHFEQFGKFDTLLTSATYEAEADGQLSNPYTADMVKADIDTLLAQYEIGDDNLYPFRVDAATTSCPLMSYDEENGNGVTLQNCTTTGSGYLTGQILGRPMPAGYERYFNHTHPNWVSCTDGFATTWYIESYGAYSPSHLPANCTQWTNELEEATNLFYGAAYYSVGNTVYAYEWAETQLQRPAFSPARPCGIDRFQYDSSSLFCIASNADKVLTLDPFGSATTIQTGNTCSVYALGDLSGMWTVTRDSDFQITLNTRIVSASQFPADDVSDNSVTSGIVKSRWQGYVPPLCGRVRVTAATNSTPITCSLAAETYLVDGDRIQIQDQNYTSPINGIWSITRLDASTIALSGSHSGSVTFDQIDSKANRSYAYPLYAASYVWANESPSGSYTFRQWYHDARSIGEYNRMLDQYNTLSSSETCISASAYTPNPGAYPRYSQSVWGLAETVVNGDTYGLPICNEHETVHSPCAPAVMYISPLTRSFANGYRHAFPTNFQLDTKYTNLWEADIKQWMYNPLYISPPCPCSENAGVFECNYIWTEDNGSCQENLGGDPATVFYKLRPYYEARCKMPDGAPPLPPLVYIGCLNQEAVNVSTQPLGNICNGPENLMPWTIYSNQASCVCANGRFAQEYQDNLARCPTAEEVI